MDARREVREYTVRDVTDDDREFLRGVYAASRAVEMNAVPWVDAVKRTFIEHQFNAQTAHYREHYPNAKHQIILVDGKAAGRLYVDRTDPAMIEMLDITILAEYQRRGVGTAIIKALLGEGANSMRIVRVYTEEFNPSLRLFERLGFEVTEKDGFLCRLDASPAEEK
jgi:RimJ/RimL family protein N-acetyltransferase